jgi:murein L,D-transpeptidase YcbB/YkuD
MSADALDRLTYWPASKFMSYARSKAISTFGMIDKGLLTLAAIGWGSFAYSIVSSRSDAQAVQAEIARLHQEVKVVSAERDRFVQERDQTIQTSGDLQYLHNKIAAATLELQRLDTMRARVSEAIDQAHPKLVTLAAQYRGNNESTTASSSASAPLSKQQIRAAQEALVDLGYGNLEADGVFGSGTSKAVEAFERAKGLPVTGNLGPATLQALRTHVASLAQ